jgi:acyl-CoA thioesterase
MNIDIDIVEKDLHRNPFDSYMDFRVDEAGEEQTILTFDNSGSTWENPNGTMYGGVLFAMADSAMEAACAVLGKAVLTVDISMNFLAPTHADTQVRAIAKIIHNGHTTMVGTCDFYDNNDRHLAHGEGTFYVTGPYHFPEKGDDMDG